MPTSRSFFVPAFAIALAAAGCDAQSGALSSVASPASEVSDSIAFYPEGPEREASYASGAIFSMDGAPIVGAQVCLDGADVCAGADRAGRFSIAGIAQDYSELLIVEAEGYIPLAVPVAMNEGAHAGLSLVMEPQKDLRPEERTGSVRFVNWTMFGLERVPDDRATWRLDDETHLGILSVKGHEGTIDNLRPGLYEAAPVTAAPPSLCSRDAGWDGATGASVTVPVLAGHITHVEQTCIAIIL